MSGVIAYRCDPSQPIQHLSFISAVQELLYLCRRKILSVPAGRSRGLGGIKCEISCYILVSIESQEAHAWHRIHPKFHHDFSIEQDANLTTLKKVGDTGKRFHTGLGCGSTSSCAVCASRACTRTWQEARSFGGVKTSASWL